jgi:hypothetical protein
MPLSGADVDILLDDLDKAFAKQQDSKDSVVRLRGAELNVLACLERLRNLMLGSLSGDKTDVMAVFGGDCQRIARVMAVLAEVEFSDMNKNDQRLQDAENTCLAMQNVIGELGSRDAMLAAAAAARKRLHDKYSEDKGQREAENKAEQEAAKRALQAQVDAPAPDAGMIRAALLDCQKARVEDTDPAMVKAKGILARLQQAAIQNLYAVLESPLPDTEKYITILQAAMMQAAAAEVSDSHDSVVKARAMLTSLQEKLEEEKAKDEEKAADEESAKLAAAAAAAAAEAEARAEAERALRVQEDGKFYVDLERKELSDKWGLVVVKGGDGSLQVKGIDEHSCAEKWNKDKPGLYIRKGDRIVSINGVEGDAQKMTAPLKDAKKIRLIIIRENEEDISAPAGAVVDAEWADLMKIRLCKLGCGRRVSPGMTRNGNPFDTCCKGCAMGGAHVERCGKVDPAKMRAGLCKMGCGRKVAQGKDSLGQAWDTCCKGCAQGKAHDEYCQTCGGYDADVGYVALDEHTVFNEIKEKLPPVAFNKFKDELRACNRRKQTVAETIKNTEGLFAAGSMLALHQQFSSLLLQQERLAIKAMKVGQRVEIEYHGHWVDGILAGLPSQDKKGRYAVQCAGDAKGTLTKGYTVRPK